MTSQPAPTLAPAGRRWLIGLAVLRSLATVTVLVGLYYLLPLDHLAGVPLAVTLVAGLLVLLAVAAWQLRLVTGARYPAARAAEALATTVPLFLLLFGLGEFSKISVAAFAAWLVIVFNVAYGVMNARQTRILAARSMGASSLRIFKDVIFFETLPQTFVGLRTAVSVALVVIIVAAMFIGAVDGLGHRIIDAQISYQLTDMYGSILVAGALGYGANLLFLVIEKVFVHWSGR